MLGIIYSGDPANAHAEFPAQVTLKEIIIPLGGTVSAMETITLPWVSTGEDAHQYGYDYQAVAHWTVTGGNRTYPSNTGNAMYQARIEIGGTSEYLPTEFICQYARYGRDTGQIETITY